MTVTIDDEIKCVGREIGLRRAVYPRKVEQGKMLQHVADKEIAVMVAIHNRLKAIQQDGKPSLWGGQ